jgi:hypothetical protein
MKIWRVEFGHNYATVDVVAKNVLEAGNEARKIAEKEEQRKYLPKEQDWISKIELLAESDN